MDTSQLGFVIIAGTAGASVKALVDAFKWYYPALPGYAYLGLALLLSPFSFWAWYTLSPTTVRPILYNDVWVATMFIGSLMTIVTAVGVTELSKSSAYRQAQAQEKNADGR